jgi:hypothetical protein
VLTVEIQVHGGGIDPQGQRASGSLRAQPELLATDSEVAAGRHNTVDFHRIDGDRLVEGGPPAVRLSPASLRERAGRLARDTVARMWMLLWLRPGQGGVDCAEPSPQPQARCASRSVRPLMCVNLYAVIVTVVSGSGREGLDRSGVNGLTLGPYGSWAG